MDFYGQDISETWSEGLADPFMDVEFDPEQQTGTDWFNLMLSASLDSRAVHGATLAATCETLTKVPEAFAHGHSIGRLHFDDRVKDSTPAGPEWRQQSYVGHAYHGSKTGNKARMLFDTGEWEPSQRTRAKNTAFVGALIAASGGTLETATSIASAVAGEFIPDDAITRTELPMAILKREAAASAKPNHTVYSHGNAQKAVVWADGQLHVQALPESAAIDWSRVTTIARYIGEGNCTVDDQFKSYAKHIGVPYAIIGRSWATTAPADYMLQPHHFDQISTDVGKHLPSSSLSEAYAGHAEGLYDSIHRMANEIAAGLVDPTLEALVRAAENMRGKAGKTKMTTGTYILSEPTRHQYSAEKAADATSTAARSWDAFTTALNELVTANRALYKSANDSVVAMRERRDYYPLVDPVLAEVCLAAVWQRALGYLSEMLHNSAISRERISRLKRSVLGNSAPLEVSIVLTNRVRKSATPHIMNALRTIIAGVVPKLRIPVSARYGQDIKALNQQKLFMTALNAHLKHAKNEWSTRYEKLANAYGLSSKPGDLTKAVLFGSAAKAFQFMTGYLLTLVNQRFVDPEVLSSSYLVNIANNYARKRHITRPPLNSLQGKDAAKQAILLDELYKPKVSFVEVEEFIYGKLFQFYSDIARGEEPTDDNEVQEVQEPEVPEIDDMETILELERQLAGELGDESTAQHSRTTVSSVLNTYDTETSANTHARANGFQDFYEAFSALGEKARFDRESDYTLKALDKVLADEAAQLVEDANSMPAI